MADTHTARAVVVQSSPVGVLEILGGPLDGGMISFPLPFTDHWNREPGTRVEACKLLGDTWAICPAGSLDEVD